MKEAKIFLTFFAKKKIKLFIQIGTSLEYGNSKPPHMKESDVNNILSMENQNSLQLNILKKCKKKKWANILYYVYIKFTPKI